MVVKKEEKVIEKIEKDHSEINKKVEKEEAVKLAYIGPTLPAGQLKCNRIFIGTVTEIKEELKPVLEKYPLVEKMLVPVDKIGEKKERARTSGNILHKYYSDLVSSMAANLAKEE